MGQTDLPLCGAAVIGIGRFPCNLDLEHNPHLCQCSVGLPEERLFRDQRSIAHLAEASYLDLVADHPSHASWY